MLIKVDDSNKITHYIAFMKKEDAFKHYAVSLMDDERLQILYGKTKTVLVIKTMKAQEVQKMFDSASWHKED